jgi:hypothetical protein
MATYHLPQKLNLDVTMDFLTATTLSGLIYDGIKNGATISFKMLKSKLQDWIIDDSQIEIMLDKLKEAGINEDLAPHAIEKRINSHPSLLEMIEKIQHPGNINYTNQISNIGNNINGSGHVTIGNITINKEAE